MARAIRARLSCVRGSIGRIVAIDVEGFLRMLADQLQGDAPSAGPAAPEGASVRDMLSACQSLRQAVMEGVCAEFGRELRPEEMRTLNLGFDVVMNEQVAAAAERQVAGMQALVDAQSKYMSFLSHDLRGSLNGAILMMEVMRRELTAAGDATEMLEDILLMRRSIMDAAGLMERHLQVDQLRRGRITAQISRVRLLPVVERVVEDLAPLALEKRLTVRVRVSEAAAVRADADLVGQALHNLVTNALRHGGGSITIEAVREQDQWAIIVSDRGPGMENELLQQWLDPVRRMQMKHRGLGLQIALYAARLMHGRLEGQAAPGQGVSMRLVLPADEPPQNG
jgi:signal transduction histidine kinase